jgi:hypothetical protein
LGRVCHGNPRADARTPSRARDRRAHARGCHSRRDRAKVRRRHALRPDRLARWVRTLLGERGVFQVSVPNLASWQAHAFRGNWLHLDVPRHRYHFDDVTLGRLLHDAGFQEASKTTVILEYDWFGAIQSPLNALCSKPNVLFERLTSAHPIDPRRLPRSDRAISYLLAPALGAASLPLCLLSQPFSAGATLDVTYRVSLSSSGR